MRLATRPRKPNVYRLRPEEPEQVEQRRLAGGAWEPYLWYPTVELAAAKRDYFNQLNGLTAADLTAAAAGDQASLELYL